MAEHGNLFVGEAARVSKDVIVRGTVVVGRGALIDSGTVLQDTVVMAGSFVGRGLELRNAIVSGSRLMRIDTDSVTEVSDQFLLSTVRPESERVRRTSSADQLVGALLLVLSLPLWSAALIASLATDWRSPMQWRRLIGNRRRNGQPVYFEVGEWKTRLPLLRYLPWLLPVVAGHVRLVGVRARPTGCAENVSIRAPAGLVGPVILDVTADATEEEISIGETLFSARDCLALRLGYFLRGLGTLFSARAWQASR